MSKEKVDLEEAVGFAIGLGILAIFAPKVLEKIEIKCNNPLPKEDTMGQWWMNKQYWIKTMSGECCSTTELMGKQEEDGSWLYALVQTAHGQTSLKALFKDGKDVQ